MKEVLFFGIILLIFVALSRSVFHFFVKIKNKFVFIFGAFLYFLSAYYLISAANKFNFYLREKGILLDLGHANILLIFILFICFIIAIINIVIIESKRRKRINRENK